MRAFKTPEMYRGLMMPERLLDCMPPCQVLVLSSGIW